MWHEVLSASRELICDSVETMLMAHQLDGLVLVPNCDKIVPGMVMAAVRMDVPLWSAPAALCWPVLTAARK